MRKILSILLCLMMAVSMLTGCGDTTKPKEDVDVVYDDYSKGLTETGYYDLEDYIYRAPKFNRIKVTFDEVIQKKVDLSNETNGTDYAGVDEWMHDYTNDFLRSLDIANAETVEDGDKVVASSEFYIDGEKLEDYDVRNEYVADKTNEDPIVASFTGHNVNDEYEVQFTMTEDSGKYAGKVADVNVKIESVAMGDPLSKNVVEENLDVLHNYFPEITSAEELIEGMKSVAAQTYLTEYMGYYIRDNIEFEVPDECVDAEMYRFKYRLNQMGYDYDKYLQDSGSTDEMTRQYCYDIAKENLVCLSVYEKSTEKIDDEIMMEYYGDQYEDFIEIQGIGYAKLKLIRDAMMNEIASQVQLAASFDNVDSTVDEEMTETTEVTTEE